MRIEATTLKKGGSGSYEESLVAWFSFDGYDCINKCCDFLFRGQTHRYSAVIAHNGSGYDNKFILNWAINHGTYPHTYIRQGSGIIYKTYRNNN